MAEYIAREWSNGDIVTASNLNQIESGVEAVTEESECLVVNVTETTAESGTEDDTQVKLKGAASTSTSTYILDKTWQQIYDAFPKVYTYVQIGSRIGKSVIQTAFNYNNDYVVYADNQYFVTDSPNGYPSTRSSSTGTNA